MKILHPDIALFIAQIKELNAVGGLRVPRAGVDGLMDLLMRADVIIGPDVQPGRVTWYRVEKDTPLAGIAAPSMLIIIEEDFDEDPAFAEKIRDKAAYMIRVE